MKIGVACNDSFLKYDERHILQGRSDILYVIRYKIDMQTSKYIAI